MSHFATIDIEIRDVDALRAACAELGLELVTGGAARGFAGNRADADHVIRLKGPYDIAVQRQGNGYALVADLWRGHVEREVGENFGRLRQLYGVHRATREARRRGLNVRRQTLADGRVRLAITQV